LEGSEAEHAEPTRACSTPEMGGYWNKPSQHYLQRILKVILTTQISAAAIYLGWKMI
jgi:hypothetical protein